MEPTLLPSSLHQCANLNHFHSASLSQAGSQSARQAVRMLTDCLSSSAISSTQDQSQRLTCVVNPAGMAVAASSREHRYSLAISSLNLTNKFTD